ncbi:hypothetical protein [Pseudomonas sp. PLMAX]|jgi:integrase|uniref:hypothetical protein n=1 Tax=Pseudomonas sp. PLMAX TaxID=2201998 RepID=UPI0038BD7834
MSNPLESQHNIINQPGSDFFYVVDTKNNTHRKLNFTWNCSIEKRIWAQKTLLLSSNFLNSNRAGPMEVRECNWAYVDTVHLKKLCEYWEDHFPTKSLWSWSRTEVKEMVRSIMVRAILPSGDPLVYAPSNLNQFCSWISISHEAYLDGRINDGFSFKATSNFKKDAMSPLMRFVNVEYPEWICGGSYGAISPAVASLLLAHSIQIIESEEVKEMQCFFRAWRKCPIGVRGIFRQWNPNNHDIFERDESHLSVRAQSLRLKNELICEFNSEKLKSPSKLPWDSCVELSESCRIAIQASMVVILTLTGHRIGELLSVNSIDWVAKGDEIVVREEIEKTLNGLKVPRYFHSLAATAVKTIWSLSFLDAYEHKLPLLHKAWSSGLADTITQKKDVNSWIDINGKLSKNTFSQWLDNYFDSFLAVYPEIKLEQPGISPHQFRHSWAEFSLRRFDHNVTAQIREYFLHKSKRATRRYTDNKLHESVQYSIEHDYLDEVIHRIVADRFGDQFRGPAFRRIIATLKHVESHDIVDFDSFIQSMCQNIETFTAYEWGYCVLFASSRQDAKCHDRFTGLPMPKVYASVERCTACPHHMTNEFQRNNLIRIAINHSHIAESHPILAVGKLSKNVVDQITKRLSE